MLRIPYCPICGMRTYEEKCRYCGNPDLLESKYDIEYYMAKSRKHFNGDGTQDFKILFEEEIANNPLFNQGKHELAQATLQCHMNASKFDPLKYNTPHKSLPKCPTCQSTNIKKISFAKGYLHWRMLGFFSKTAMSQWECKNCGHKW